MAAPARNGAGRRSPRCLYFFLMLLEGDSHRFFIPRHLIPLSLRHIVRSEKEQSCLTSSCWVWGLPCSPCRLVTPTFATGSEEASMIFDYALAGLVTAGLLFYLTYALLRPERF